jgi:hypothetical protein
MIKTAELFGADGIVHLSFFDNINGHDRYFDLRADGTAWELTYDDQDNEQYAPVDLIRTLRAMAEYGDAEWKG